MRGGGQVWSQYVGIVGVEDGRLEWCVEQRRGVIDQIGVERLVPCDEDAQCLRTPRGGTLLPPAGSAELLLQACPGPGEADRHHGIEPGDVDAKLKCVGGGEPKQVTGSEPGFELAALLRGDKRKSKFPIRSTSTSTKLTVQSGRVASPRPYSGAVS